MEDKKADNSQTPEDGEKLPEEKMVYREPGKGIYSQEEDLIYGRNSGVEKPTESNGSAADEKYKELIDKLSSVRSDFVKSRAEWKKIHDRDQATIHAFRFGMGESASEIKARELLAGAEKEYDKAGAEYCNKLHHDKLAALGENPSPEQLADLKAQILEGVIFGENENLAKTRAELAGEKENKLYQKILQRYGELPMAAKIALSATVATGVAAFSAPALGVAGVGTYFMARIYRAAFGTAAGVGAGQLYGWLYDRVFKPKEIRAKGEEAIKTELKIKAGQEENLDKLFDNSLALARERFDKLSEKEKRIVYGKAISQGLVVAGVAGLSSWGLGKYYEASGLTPTLETVKAPVGSALSGPESGVPGAAPFLGPEVKPEVSGAVPSVSETGLKANPEILKQLEQLAIIQKGDGIENVLIRQLEADPANMGCDSEVIAKGKGAVHQWAQGEADRIALQTEYVKTDPTTGQSIETRVYWDEKQPARFRLTYDAANQEYTVYPENAKTYQWMAPDTRSGSVSAAIEPGKPGPADPENASTKLVNELGDEFKARLDISPDDPRYKTVMSAKIGDIMNQIPKEALADAYGLDRLWHNQGEFAGRPTLNLPHSGALGLGYDEYRGYAEIAKFLHENNAVVFDPNLTLADLHAGKVSAAAEAPAASRVPATPEQVEKIMHSDAPPAEKPPPVEKAAEIIGGLPSEKQKIVSGIISGMAEQGKTGTVAAQELINQVKAGNLKIEEFGNYYAQQTGAERLSDKLMDNLKKTFADAQSSGTQKASGMMGIAIMLERLKQESLVK